MLTAIHRACADGVSGLKWQSFCCCSEYSHPSPPFFSSGSWVLRFLFGMGRSLAKSRRHLDMNRRDFLADQKLRRPDSQSSDHVALGDALSARKHVATIAPTVRPTPMTMRAVRPCSYVIGLLS